jgi:hypothetical protein
MSGVGLPQGAAYNGADAAFVPWYEGGLLWGDFDTGLPGEVASGGTFQSGRSG